MNKTGVVMESGDGWAILLLKNGEYKKIKTRRQLYEGELYTFSLAPGYKSLATAAVLLIVLTFSLNFFPVVAYASFSSGVDLGVNRWGQVVYMKVSSPEGESLVAGLEIWGHNIEAVLPEILDRVVAIEQEAGNSYDIAIDIKSAQTEDNNDQRTLEKINTTVSEHKNPNGLGYWNKRYDDARWRWESSDRGEDDKQGHAQNNKPNSRDSNYEQNNRSGNDNKNWEDKNRNQSEEYDRSDNDRHDDDSDRKNRRDSHKADSHGDKNNGHR